MTHRINSVSEFLEDWKKWKKFSNGGKVNLRRLRGKGDAYTGQQKGEPKNDWSGKDNAYANRPTERRTEE